jgi:lambda family phage portal protein
MKLFGLDITRTSKVERQHKRGRPPAVKLNRFLDSANHGRLEEAWVSTPQTADSIIYKDWKPTVARCMEQANNTPHARKFLSMLKDNVAGPNGFSLQANVRNASGSKDERANKAIEEAYKEFSDSRNFEVTGQFSRAQFERLGISTCATHGEFMVVRIVDRSINEWGIAFQILDPLMVDSTYFADLGDGVSIRAGIEMDAFRRPLAYHVNQYDSWGHSFFESYNKRIRIPIERVTHAFMPELINQPRGLPWMRTSLWQMRMLKGYGDAAVTNARIAASKMGFFRSDEAEDDEDEMIDAAEPGAFEDIGNRTLVDWDPQYPNGEFDPFTKSVLHWLASGLLVSYHSLTGDLSDVNFSSIRQGELDQREVWKGLQSWYSEALCRHLYEQWLEIAIMSDKIKVGNTPLRLDRFSRYKRVNFIGRRWDWVDPLKDINAKAKEIELGITSRARVIRERSNEDPNEIFEEVKKEQEQFRDEEPEQH